MAYPFVKAYHDYGRRLGPTLAFVIHMAEGGGTVGYLSRQQSRGVSVHYVIEYSGRIVQMLQEDHASGSINPNDLRTTDGPAPFGATPRKAVLGRWDTNPNEAVLSVEIEGFALQGPNASQRAALKELVRDIRTRYPDIGLLGHRDFADYKRCPGAFIPWAQLGGHGPAGGGDVAQAPITDETVHMVTAREGHTWRDLDGLTVLETNRPALAARVSPYGITNSAGVELRAIYAYTGDERRIVMIVPATDTPLPPGDCADAIAADRANARIVWD